VCVVVQWCGNALVRCASFATHLLESGYGVRTIQQLMGNRDLRTAMISLHVLNRGGPAVWSPLDLPPVGRGGIGGPGF
jgi:integrase